jgi:hypothetical protein
MAKCIDSHAPSHISRSRSVQKFDPIVERTRESWPIRWPSRCPAPTSWRAGQRATYLSVVGIGGLHRLHAHRRRRPRRPRHRACARRRRPPPEAVSLPRTRPARSRARPHGTEDVVDVLEQGSRLTCAESVPSSRSIRTAGSWSLRKLPRDVTVVDLAKDAARESAVKTGGLHVLSWDS